MARRNRKSKKTAKETKKPPKAQKVKKPSMGQTVKSHFDTLDKSLDGWIELSKNKDLPTKAKKAVKKVLTSMEAAYDAAEQTCELFDEGEGEEEEEQEGRALPHPASTKPSPLPLLCGPDAEQIEVWRKPYGEDAYCTDRRCVTCPHTQHAECWEWYAREEARALARDELRAGVPYERTDLFQMSRTQLITLARLLDIPAEKVSGSDELRLQDRILFRQRKLRKSFQRCAA